MFFSLVSPKAKSVQFGLRLWILLAGLICSLSAQAQWQDPLNTPAAATHKAHQALLLDVVRVGQRLVAVGAYGHIIYSDDQGESWQQGQVPVSVTLTAVYFAGEQNGWAVGHDGVILATNDGGLNWHKQFDGYQANKAIVAAAQSHKDAAMAALEQARNSAQEDAIEEAELRLEDATYAFEDAQYDDETGSTKPFLDVWFYDAKRGYALGAYGMFFATSDGGENWQDVSRRLPNPDRLHLNSIASVGGRSLVAVGEQGLIVRSDDLGLSWHSTPSPYDGSLFGLVSVADTQLLFGLRGHVYQSSDAGITWTEIMTGSEQTLLGGLVGRQQALLVGNGGAVVSFNRRLNAPQSRVLKGRKASAAVAETQQGFVLVGEAGVKLLDSDAQLINMTIKMTSADRTIQVAGE